MLQHDFSPHQGAFEAQTRAKGKPNRRLGTDFWDLFWEILAPIHPEPNRSEILQKIGCQIMVREAPEAHTEAKGKPNRRWRYDFWDQFWEILAPIRLVPNRSEILLSLAANLLFQQ